MRKTFLLDDNSQKENEAIFKEMIRKVRPDLFVLVDVLDETGVNPLVIWKIVRQLALLSQGTGYGTIRIEIQNHIVTFIHGEEDDKVQEKLTIESEKTI